MRQATLLRQLIAELAIAMGLPLLAAAPGLAHCDTVDGPVVIADAALESGSADALVAELTGAGSSAEVSSRGARDQAALGARSATRRVNAFPFELARPDIRPTVSANRRSGPDVRGRGRA